jgi:hypothetical protein
MQPIRANHGLASSFSADGWQPGARGRSLGRNSGSAQVPAGTSSWVPGSGARKGQAQVSAAARHGTGTMPRAVPDHSRSARRCALGIRRAAPRDSIPASGGIRGAALSRDKRLGPGPPSYRAGHPDTSSPRRPEPPVPALLRPRLAPSALLRPPCSVRLALPPGLAAGWFSGRPRPAAASRASCGGRRAGLRVGRQRGELARAGGVRQICMVTKIIATRVVHTRAETVSQLADGRDRLGL